MTVALIFEQLLNGLQLGVMLFLLAAGLTLVFGIMNMVNLAHGSLYMIGAYLRRRRLRSGPARSCSACVAGARSARCCVGMVVEVVALRTLYERDHLDQVLATFGLILFFNELVAILWGRAALFASLPPCAAGHDRDLRRAALSGLPARDHRRRPRGRAAALYVVARARASAC